MTALRRPGGERRLAPIVPLTDDCTRCHELGGDVRVIVGIGARRLHPVCERRLTSMGYEVREERRHAA